MSAQGLTKREWLGIALLGFGSLLGFLLGGMFGLGLAAVFLVLGLVLMVASTALSPIDSSQASGSPTAKTELLVLLKEVHCRPLRRGKFQEIRDPDQPDLQFEIFLHGWLVNDTDQTFSLSNTQVSVTRPDGSVVALPQRHDLQDWTLGRLRDETDSLGLHYLQATSEKMAPLDCTEALGAGATHQGWIHVSTEGFTPKELQSSSFTLVVHDGAGQEHTGVAKGPHQVPGRVWRLAGSLPEASANRPSEVQTKKE